jgi:hypothetical protein
MYGLTPMLIPTPLGNMVTDPQVDLTVGRLGTVASVKLLNFIEVLEN